MSASGLDTVVYGGEIVGPSSVYRADIAILEGKITAIGVADQWPTAREKINAIGKQIFPGIVDVHVHCQTFSHHVDTLKVVSESGAHGGVTSILTMVRPSENMLPSEGLTHFIEVEGQECVVDFGFHAGLLDRPGFLEDIPKVAELGVTSFKLMMAYKKHGTMSSDPFLYGAMKKVVDVGGLTMVHAEDGNIIDLLEDEMIATGRMGFRDFYRTRPNWTEEMSVFKAVEMAELANCPLYIVHLSASEALARIKQAHAAGKRVWTETCPQYLLLTDDLMETMGPLAKIAPPLRTVPDLEAMWKGVINGWIAVIGSDHSPHTRETKRPGYKNIFDAWFGCPGIETMVPLLYSEAVVKRGLPPWLLARRLSENPARIFGLYPRKGAIQVGSDADLVILDPLKEMTIRAENQHTNADFTLFEGWKVKGVPVLTLLRGNILLQDGQLCQKPGYGQYLRREPFGGAWKLGKGGVMM